jgi:hypothetical protein
MFIPVIIVIGEGMLKLMWFRFCIVVAFTVTFAMAQDLSVQRDRIGESAARISGTVVAIGGAPLASVKLTLNRLDPQNEVTIQGSYLRTLVTQLIDFPPIGGPPAAISDEFGRYSFDQLEAGTYAASAVDKQGYPMATLMRDEEVRCS